MWSNKYPGNGGNRVRVVSRHGGTAGGGYALLDHLVSNLVEGLAAYEDCAVELDPTSLSSVPLERKRQEPFVRDTGAQEELDPDYVLVVGGDGTMVGQSRAYARKPSARAPKLLGINAGHLGFVTDLPSTVPVTAVYEVLKEKHTLEQRTLLRFQGQLALNDVVLKATDGRLMEFSVYISGVLAYRCRADGLLVTTPTGSTAYATSANGAILSPTARVFEIMPLLPQTLAYRPLVINESDTIEVCIHNGSGGIFLDGNLYQSLEKDQTYRIEKALEEVTFCHPTSAAYGYNFFHTLRTKLYWHLEPGKDVHA